MEGSFKMFSNKNVSSPLQNYALPGQPCQVWSAKYVNPILVYLALRQSLLHILVPVFLQRLVKTDRVAPLCPLTIRSRFGISYASFRTCDFLIEDILETSWMTQQVPIRCVVWIPQWPEVTHSEGRELCPLKSTAVQDLPTTTYLCIHTHVFTRYL